MLLGAIAGFVLVVVLSNTNREDTARLVTLAFLAGVAYEPIVINGLEAIGLSRSDGQALLSAEASTRVSADAVDFEELFTELNEKLEQEDTNRVDRKSTRLNSSHVVISYAVFCSKKKKNRKNK